jgi:hypothetical protein
LAFKSRREVVTALAPVAFLPSLGMVWRGMWSLAYVPPQIDEVEEVPSVEA